MSRSPRGMTGIVRPTSQGHGVTGITWRKSRDPSHVIQVT